MRSNLPAECPRLKFGYADEVALLRISPSLHHNTQSLKFDVEEVFNWGLQENLSFDHEKSGLIHFSRRRSDPDSIATPCVNLVFFTVSEETGRPYTRWLGILFDKKLNFK